jgi:methylated-DNA-protein-cysteine methyltransferase related protein
MSSQRSNFAQCVNQLVANIPSGRAMTYGQIAALCGSPRSARIVGGIAHHGDPDLPWHRVVSKKGGLASGYPGGRKAHKEHLQSEGVYVSEGYKIDIEQHIWWPDGWEFL